MKVFDRVSSLINKNCSAFLDDFVNIRYNPPPVLFGRQPVLGTNYSERFAPETGL